MTLAQALVGPEFTPRPLTTELSGIDGSDIVIDHR